MHPPPPAIPPHLSRHLALFRPAAANFLSRHGSLILCALFLLAGLATAGNYGLGLDAVSQRRIAQVNLNYILVQGDEFDTLPYPHAFYSVAFELPLLLAEQALGLDDYYDVHRLRLILTHLFFIVGGYFCYRLAYRLFNSRLIALFALLLFLLHPRIYAHSFVNSKDLPFLALFVIALYLLERAFRRDTPAAFLLLGIAVGLLTNLRIMGMMLLPAVIAMRGLDLFHAGSGPPRRRILLTAALFLLAAGLTWYAATPYAWNNPVDYLAASLDLTLRHPHTAWQLFQGQLIPSNDLPPHYTLTWFSITTPPVILLLGLIGIAAVALCGLRRPAAFFRNTRLRFALLLPACFLLPPLAAALLGSVQYDHWRHFFFCYAPFCLLAAGGLRGLTNALSPGRPWRAGIYALAAAGLGLVLLQMTQIHPLPHNYFNFLVNRAAPEQLRTQYEMDGRRSSHREGLEYLLTRHPHATVAVRGGKSLPRQLRLLPPATRQRLQIADGNRRADYELTHNLAPTQPDLAFNSAYRRRLYNNTLITARPLDAALMSAAAIAAYREIYRQTLAQEPLIHADYKVYLNDKRLTFVRENCPPNLPDAWLGVKLFPHHPETLPPPLPAQPGSYAPFGNLRVRLDDLCLAVLQLPAYAQGDLIVMQRRLGNFGPGGEPLWQELHSLSQPGLGELIAQGRQNRQPAAAPIPLILNSIEGRSAAFEVFLDRSDGRNRLLYAKPDCAPTDYATPLFLHIAPVNLADLPAHRQASGFANHDFPIDHYGGRPGGDCIAIVPLPEYPIAAIRTGQFVAGQGEVWAAELTLEP